jgi:hypothetical protein
MQGPVEFETACSEAIRAMTRLTDRAYRAMTRRERVEWALGRLRLKGAVDDCAICAETLDDAESPTVLPTSSSSSSSSTSSLLSPSSSSPSSSSSSSSAATGGSSDDGGEGDDDAETKGEKTRAVGGGNGGDSGDSGNDADDAKGKEEADVVQPLWCDHVIHRECMQRLLAHSNSAVNDSCPTCKTRFATGGARVGTQPTGHMRVRFLGDEHLPGFPAEGRIEFEAHFPPDGGIQGPRHPHPGHPYTAHGFPRVFYLPESQHELAFRMQLAFYWRNFFAVGTSQTAASSSSSSSASSATERKTQAVVWSSAVSVKNDLEPGGTRSYSATDPQANADYFRLVSSQLDALGITAEFAATTRANLSLRDPIV